MSYLLESLERLMEFPSAYKNAGYCMIFAGGVNFVLGLVVCLGFISTGWGVFVCFMPLFSVVIGVAEIVFGLQVAQGQPSPNARWVSLMGVVGGVCCCLGIVPIVLELIASIFFHRNAEVEAWLKAETVS